MRFNSGTYGRLVIYMEHGSLQRIVSACSKHRSVKAQHYIIISSRPLAILLLDYFWPLVPDSDQNPNPVVLAGALEATAGFGRSGRRFRRIRSIHRTLGCGDVEVFPAPRCWGGGGGGRGKLAP